MSIGSTFERTAPCGRVITITPSNQKEVEYYRSLEDHGYKYKQKVTIHNNLTECESCSA